MKSILGFILIGAVASSFSFAAGETEGVNVGGVLSGVHGSANYSFQVTPTAGENDEFSIGAEIPGYRFGLEWDQINSETPQIFARVYDHEGNLYVHDGLTYNVNLPVHTVERLEEWRKNPAPLTFNFRFDSTVGNVSVRDPFAANDWWRFYLPSPDVFSDGRFEISVGTKFGSAKFENFSVLDDLPTKSGEFAFPSEWILRSPFETEGERRETQDLFYELDSEVTELLENDTELTTVLQILDVSLEEFQELSKRLPSLFSDLGLYERGTITKKIAAGQVLSAIISQVDQLATNCPELVEEAGKLAARTLNEHPETRRVAVHTLDDDSEHVNDLSVYRLRFGAHKSDLVSFRTYSSPTSKDRIYVGKWCFWACDDGQRVSAIRLTEITSKLFGQKVELRIGDQQGPCVQENLVCRVADS